MLVESKHEIKLSKSYHEIFSKCNFCTAKIKLNVLKHQQGFN